MISLSDEQLQTVMRAAHTLPVEKRDVYLQRIAALLRQRGRFGDADVADVAQQALHGPIQQPAA
jgi:hypothetical protein